VHGATDISSWAKDRGVKWYMLYNFIPVGRGLDIVRDDLTPYERKALLEKAFLSNSGGMQVLSTAPQYAPIAATMSAGKSNTIIPTHFANPEDNNDTMQQLVEFIGGCGAGRFYLAVEPNGDMYPCVFLPHEPELKVGNLMRDDREKVWQEHPVLRILRDKDQLKGSCATCHNRYICGGCRARAYGYFHDIRAPDPGCVNNIAYWDKLRASVAPEDMIPMFGETKSDWENGKSYAHQSG
jgi:radical SAM protein with 4Fe4S-binding SPASM domain